MSDAAITTRRKVEDTRVSRLFRYLTSVRKPLMAVTVREVKRLPWLQRVLLGLVIAIGVTVVVDTARRTGLFEVVEGATFNTRVVATADPAGQDSRIVMVVIDQKSLTSFAQDRGGLRMKWPWPRSMYVPVLDYFRRAGVKLVAFDMFFSETTTKVRRMTMRLRWRSAIART